MNRDREKAKRLIDGDPELNRLEIEVEQAAVELLACSTDGARPPIHYRAIKCGTTWSAWRSRRNIAESALRLADKPKVSIRIPEIEGHGAESAQDA